MTMLPNPLAVLALALVVTGPENAEAAEVLAARVDRAPAIDGRLDDRCWSVAQAATTFLVNNTTTPAQFTSHARVVYDDRALYVAVKCDEPDVASIQTRPLERDDSDVFRTDCIEIMLDPERGQNDYYHIGVNASGSVADRACTQGGYIGDMSWDAPVTAASFIGDDFWSCEVAIPFYSLGLSPRVGPSWGINICREKKKPAENSSIAEQGAFNIAARFAELRGVDADLSRYWYGLGEPRAESVLREGELELSLEVAVRDDTGESTEVLLDGWLIGPDGSVVAATRRITPPQGRDEVFSLGPLRVTEQGDYACHVRVATAVTKETLAYRKTLLLVEYVPVTIAMVEPWYRNAIFATQELDSVVVDVGVTLEDEARGETTLEVCIVRPESDAPLARRMIEEVAEENRVVFGAGGLPEVRMHVAAALRDEAGEALAETTHPLRKLPYREGEVWLDRDMNWRVDGRPFFLNGAWNYADGFIPGYNAFSGERPGDVKLIDTAIMNDLHYKAPSLRSEALSDEDAEMCRAHARQAQGNPKLLAYYISDEPEVANIKAKVLEQVYRVFADEDPYHPVIISNDSMHGLQAYADCADINGLHPYPVTLQSERVNDLGSVAAFVEGSVRFFADRDHKQTIAYLHQGFNYGDYGAVNNRIPTYVEYRNQNLLALICGARGCIQFNRLVAHYPELYIGMPHLTRELAFAGPVVLSPTSSIAPTADAESVRMLLKEADGHLYLLACNADMAPREVAITIPGIGGRTQELRVVSEGRSVPLEGDRFVDRFDTYEVHVYTTGPDPGLPTVAQIESEIDEANQRRHKPGNLAFQAFEGGPVVVTASSSKAAKYRRPDTGLWHVVDGVIDEVDRYGCLTWQDDTDDEFPDWLEVRLPEAQRVGRVVVYPFEKSLRDYRVQAFVDGEWREVGEVTGQKAAAITHEFEPVTTERVRLVVAATNGSNSMVTEVEVYEE